MLKVVIGALVTALLGVAWAPTANALIPAVNVEGISPRS